MTGRLNNFGLGELQRVEVRGESFIWLIFTVTGWSRSS